MGLRFLSNFILLLEYVHFILRSSIIYTKIQHHFVNIQLTLLSEQKNNTQKFKFTAEVELTPNLCCHQEKSITRAGRASAVRRQLKTNLRKIGVTAFVNFLGW